MSKIHKKTGSTCMICEDPLNKNNSVIFHKTLRQTHSLCVDCTVGYLSSILAQSIHNVRNNLRIGVEEVKCPGSIHGEYRNICKHVTKFNSLIIPECAISLDLFRLNYVLRTNNVYFCQEIKCKQILEIDSEYNDNHIICHDGCRTSWCRNCLVSPYHNGKSCIEAESENKNTENGKLICELKNQGKLKFCPQCRVPCMKNNGCNKMLCVSCGSKWCWLCEQNNVDYNHFNSDKVGVCNGKLWEGVDVNEEEFQVEPEPFNNMILPPEHMIMI